MQWPFIFTLQECYTKAPQTAFFFKVKFYVKKTKICEHFCFVFSVCIFLIFVRVQLGGLLTSEVRLG